MAIGHGYKTWIGFAKDTTYGTSVAPAKFVEMTEEGILVPHKKLVKPTLGRVSQNKFVDAKKDGAGAVTFPLTWTGQEMLLENALGTLVTTGAGPYTHTFSLSGAVPGSLTTRVNRDVPSIGGANADVYPGCVVEKLTLKQEIEDFLMATTDLVVRDRSTAADSSPTYPAYDQIDWGMFTSLTWGGGSLVMDGADPEAIQSIEFTIENKFNKERFGLGSRLMKIPLRNDERVVTVKCTLEYSGDTLVLVQGVYSKVEGALTLVWTSGAKTLTINLPRAFLQGEPPTTKGRDVITLELEWMARMSAVDNDEATLVLVNNNATPLA